MSKLLKCRDALALETAASASLAERKAALEHESEAYKDANEQLTIENDHVGAEVRRLEEELRVCEKEKFDAEVWSFAQAPLGGKLTGMHAPITSMSR